VTEWTVDQVDQPQLWEIILGRMREAVLSGQLPAGSRLVERDLAARFGTSRGPIRDAIRELAREGLAVETPRRGTVVSTLTARDLTEVYLVRESLEAGACRAIIRGAATDEIQRLSAHLDAFDDAWSRGASFVEAAEHDVAFHRALVSLTGNRRLIAVYEQMLNTTVLLLRTAAEASSGLRVEIEPWVHRAILDALLARDADRVQAAVAEHYRVAEDRLFGLAGEAA